jgi:hypothetical protein
MFEWTRRCSAATAAVILMSFCSATAVAQTPPPFNLNTGNVLVEVIIPTLIPVLLGPSSPGVSPGDATLVLRNVLVVQAAFDALAPYHPTAVGISSNLGRRPASESTLYNKNVAILYASYRLLNGQYPTLTAKWVAMVASTGLNPNDNSTSLASPIGIGNVAGAAVFNDRAHDGMNMLGDEGGRVYNRRPYEDTTGYQPVNTAYELRDYTRWQPDIITNKNGIFRVQQFVTPQIAFTRAYSYENVNAYSSPPLLMQRKNNAGRQEYRRQVDRILAASAALTDDKKMTAELFNDKVQSLGFATIFIALSRGFTIDQLVQYELLTNIAAFDGAIATWNQKLRYDAIRPFAAVRYVYGNQMVTANGGPGMGTVSNIRGNEWRPYLPTADHADYPSGSACFCAAHAQVSRRFLGSDALGFTVNYTAGASVIEPGVTPAAPLTLTFPTFTDFEERCSQSRVNGGVHFQPAVDEGRRLCKPIGDRAFEFVDAHIRGVPPPHHHGSGCGH